MTNQPQSFSIKQVAKKTGNFFLEYLVLTAIIILVAVTAIVARDVDGNHVFFTEQNLTNLMRQFGPLSFLALGVTFVVIAQFIDLSAPGIIALSAYSALMLMDVIGEGPAILAGIVVGTSLGILNATLIIKSGATTQAKALFVTFGMSTIYLAVTMIIRQGQTIDRSFIEAEMPITQFISRGMIGPFTVTFAAFVFFVIVLIIFERKTFMGRAIRYTGGNIVAADLAGLPTKKVIITVYALCGLMAALCALVLYSRVPVVTPGMGRFFERDAILAVVVGGTSLVGGRGSVLRTVFGVSLITLMSNCMNLLAIDSLIQEILRGGILVLAIWLDHRRHRG